MPSVLAAQLYTLRDFTKTPADIATTLNKVRKIGYQSVQCSALGPIAPKELAKILHNEGLTCCATHVPFERLRDETAAVADEHHILNCKYPAAGMMPKTYERTAAGYKTFATDATAVARKLAAHRLVFGYHNHSFELEKFPSATTGLDILIDNTDPIVTFEIDTYWIQHGGGDPAAWIRKLAGRIPLVHLKDMAIALDHSSSTSANPIMAEVGEGNMNWPSILAACNVAGVEWYIVEQDICQRDPFESLANSFRNLKEMGVQ